PARAAHGRTRTPPRPRRPHALGETRRCRRRREYEPLIAAMQMARPALSLRDNRSLKRPSVFPVIERQGTFAVSVARRDPAGGAPVRVFRHEARCAAAVGDDLKRNGRPIGSILREVGLTQADVADPHATISYGAYVGLIERAAVALDDA